MGRDEPVIMNYLQNLHTHTCYCDGKDTPEEIVLTALDKGFGSIGFSGHSYMTYSKFSVKHGDRTEPYKEEVNRLKKVYQDKIKIFCGLEVDMYSAPDIDMSGYDYLIGAVHYLKYENEYLAFDRNADAVETIINKYFGGNGLAYAKAYYRALLELPDYGNFDIIGHFDVITKHAENRDFFDTSSKEYTHAALEAAEALVGKIPLFEVNTGAIARGYRTTPYPSIPIIKELKRLGFGVVITSDCHDRQMLDCQFKEAATLLKDCGYKEKYLLTEQGFIPVPL